MFDLQSLMAMFGPQAAAGQGLQASATALAPNLANAGAVPMPSIGIGLQPGSPPVLPGMGGQGLQGLTMPQATPDVLDKLANAPIDPMKILQLLDQQQGQQPQAHAQAVAPAAGRNVGQMQQLQGQPLEQRAGLAQFLGR